MKILIAYYSQTGNTKKVAKSMKKGLAEEDVDLKKIKELSPEDLKDYDLLLLGSGIYAGKIHKSAVTLVKKADKIPPKVAFFCTHASPDAYQHGFKVVKRILAKIDSEVIGEWDCRGANLGVPEEIIEQRLANLPPEQREKAKKDQEELKSHPDEDDLANAEQFAEELISYTNSVFSKEDLE